MHAVQKVIAVHHGSDTRHLHSLAECREIDFVKGSLVDIAARMMAAPFLVVRGKMLHSCDDAL